MGSWVLTRALVRIIGDSRSLSRVFLAREYFNIGEKLFYKNKRLLIIYFLFYVLSWLRVTYVFILFTLLSEALYRIISASNTFFCLIR